MMELELGAFADLNPDVNPDLFLEHARVALSRFHRSPMRLRVEIDSTSVSEVLIHFPQPDPRSIESLQPKEWIEKGAIVIAGLLLPHHYGLRIVQIATIGESVDYYLGTSKIDPCAILEVGGTDHEDCRYRANRKRKQVEESLLFQEPHSIDGVISVTRFQSPAVSILERMRARTP